MNAITLSLPYRSLDALTFLASTDTTRPRPYPTTATKTCLLARRHM